MATNKNITMKQYNGTDYDVLYPKTKVSQVDGAVASVNNVTPDNTGAVKIDTFDQSIKVGKNVDVGTDGGASAVQFHFDGNANAYTSRIVESESGALTVDAILKLTQALGFGYGGTGATTAAGARKNLGLGNTTGPVPIANGGTGAKTVEGARNALGLGNTSGPLPVANGGTGAKSFNANYFLRGNGTSAVKASSLLDVLKELFSVDTNRTPITDFNSSQGLTAGLWQVYNASGTDGNGPYSGAMGGIALIVPLINAANGSWIKVYQLFLDDYGDVYYKVPKAGTSYGTWKKLTNEQ